MKMKHVTFPNGNMYHGHVNQRGEPHGTALRFDNLVEGWVYDGRMRDGMRDGVGTCHHDDGAWYTGDWVNDVPNGNGRGVTTSGKWFDGNVVRGGPMGQVCLQVECVVSGCPQALLPSQRIIPRRLATQLGRPHGNCNPFWVSFNTSTHAGGLTIDGIGTLSDATVANGPAIHGAFREVGPHFDMVDPDMPHVEIMASDQVSPMVLPMQNVLQRHSLMQSLKPHVQMKRLEMSRKPHYRAFASDASAYAFPPDWFEVDLTRRRELIKKGKKKLAKYTQSKHHMAVDEHGGRRKSRRMRHRRRTLKFK